MIALWEFTKIKSSTNATRFLRGVNGEKGDMALNTFGKRLRSLRQEAGLTQIELRDEILKRNLGATVGETYISELERTDKMPMLDVAAAMARVLGTSLDYFALLIGDPKPIEREMPPHYFSAEADEVAQIVDAMQPDQRVLVLNLTRTLIPANGRQRRLNEALEILESIERNWGEPARKDVERTMRNNNIPIDDVP